MKRMYIAQSVKASKKYLSVIVRVDVGSTVRWTEVKVPWRILNDQHEAVINGMEGEALERLKERWEVPMLPLERWE